MQHGLVVLAMLTVATPALAQSSPASAPSPSATMSAAPPSPSGTQSAPERGGAKAVISGCRDEAVGQGLKGEAKRDSISACVVRQRPDLAGRMACRKQGYDKGLRKEELHAFVKECLSGKG